MKALFSYWPWILIGIAFVVALINAKPIQNAIDFLGRSISYFYLFAVIISTWEIVLRYGFNAPTLWAHELVICFCGLCYLLSGGIVTQDRAHIRITALYQIVSSRIKWYLDLFAMTLGAVCIGLLIHASLRQTRMAIMVWEKTGSAWDPPLQALIKPGISIGAVLVFIANLILLINHLNNYKNPEQS